MDAEQKRKRRPRGSRKREQLRRAAYLCFRKSGYHDTTVDAICQVSETSKGSFYWHYQSKQDVFIDILETWAREVMDELYEQFEDAMEQEDYIGSLTWALEREIHRGRVIVPLWLEFGVHATRDPEIKDRLSKFYRRARSAITEILRPMLERRFSEQEMQSISATIFGAYTGLMIQDLSDPERADAREMVRRFMGVINWWLQHLNEDPQPPDKPRTASLGARITDQALLEYLSDFPEPVRRRTHEARDLLLRAAPEINERVISGWRVLAYGDRKGLIAYIQARADAVHFGFYQGAALPDPSLLLAGKGKQRRHVALPLTGSLPRTALKDLLEAAVTFQRL